MTCAHLMFQAQLLQPGSTPVMAEALKAWNAQQQGVSGTLQMLDSLNRGVRERSPG